MQKVVELLSKKYGKSRTEKVEKAVDDMLKFREDSYEEDNDLIIAMRELNQRRKELKMTYNEFFSVWMFGKIKKQKKMEGFEIQALRDIIKVKTEEVPEKLEKKFIEVWIEGKRKSVSSSAMFTETLPRTHYTEREQAEIEAMYTEREQTEIEAMYMGTELEARKRFQRGNSFNRGWLNFFNRGQSRDRSFLRDSRHNYRSIYDC